MCIIDTKVPVGVYKDVRDGVDSRGHGARVMQRSRTAVANVVDLIQLRVGTETTNLFV